MSLSLAQRTRKAWRRTVRRALGALPRSVRFEWFRRMVDCDPAPSSRLVVKIAETQIELEACFALLHDAYVASGFMKTDPSGLRVTPYHALPTTTTLCAKWDGSVVGTISMVREGVFGFPLQHVFDVAAVRAKGGNIAEISALAVDPRFRATGGAILFPLLKFMYEYSTRFFDTRHLVIAVHPAQVELYESLLFFKRLQASVVDHYDFVNGAPAIGATLDLQQAPEIFRRAYEGKSARRNLHRYFVKLTLPQLQFPERHYFITNDPVLTPELLDHFFNRRVQLIATLPLRQLQLLHSIYDSQAFRDVLPPPTGPAAEAPTRHHRRYSIRLPARLDLDSGQPTAVAMDLIEISQNGFQAKCSEVLPLDRPSLLRVDLGQHERSAVRAVPVRRHAFEHSMFYGFRVDHPDAPWRRCVNALEQGLTRSDLQPAAH